MQYPKATEYLSCYIESRGGKFKNTLFFGLQMFLKKYLCKPITQENIDEAEEIIKIHGVPFNKSGWEYILDKYAGHLPIYIESVPEGTKVPNNNVLLQITNTDPKCFLVANILRNCFA